MAKKASRKFFLFGKYSLALLLPKKWLTELGADRKTTVSLEYDHKKKRIIVKFSPTSSSKTTKPKKDKQLDETWQPIPQI